MAGGVESMSRVPMGASGTGGDPFAPLLRRYPEGLVMQGVSAELVAAHWKLSRRDVDEYASRSHERAAAFAAAGGFADEIVPVDVVGADGTSQSHERDETIRPATTVDALTSLKPSFTDAGLAARFPDINWIITPGNSSPLTDGASAVLLMSTEKAAELGLKARARFHAFAVTGSDPLMMLTGVIPATHKVLSRAHLSLAQMDTYEVNEAFAPVPLAWSRVFNADPDRLNPRGGAIALGHPLGASGTRLLGTMLNHLEATGGRYGLQTMCEGGGMANALVIERL
jgi:acetyl-CoA acyltransferase